MDWKGGQWLQHLIGRDASMLWLAGLAAGTCILTYLLIKLAQFAISFSRLSRGMAASGAPLAPGGNWVLGHVLPLLNCTKQNMGAWDLMSSWLTQATQQGKPALVRYRIGPVHGVAVSDPLALKRVFQTRQTLYNKELALSYKPFLPILGTGLVTADGALWQKQRLLIGPALRSDILDDIIDIAQRATQRLIAKLEPHRGSGKPVELEEEFRLLKLQVIGEAVLSLGPEECDKVFPVLYLPVMTEANNRVLRPYRMYLPILPAWWQFRARMAKLNTYLINLFRERWQAHLKGVKRARTDVLDRILDSIQESGAPWNEELEQQLCYEIKTFLLAGHETSAAMLTWSVFELSQAPELAQKVMAEAEQVFGPLSPNQIPARRDVDNMVYTLSVLKEALRKYSVVPVVTRTLVAEDELCGYKIPAGTMIACILQHTHMMYKDPETFNPERFMPDGEYDQFEEARRLFMFMPFIQGPRNCLGQWLALLEARVVLSLLMKTFKFRTAKPGQGQRSPTVIPIGPMHGMEVYLD